MVDALEAVRRALRPRGLVFDLQPEATYLPTVAVRDSRGRRSIGVLDREPDEDVIAAREARERVVRESRFVRSEERRVGKEGRAGWAACRSRRRETRGRIEDNGGRNENR